MVTISKRFGIALLGMVFSLIILIVFGVWTIYSENTGLFRALSSSTGHQVHSMNYKYEVEYSPPNPNISQRLHGYYSEIFQSRDVDVEHENFTLVMLTYKRETTLPKVLLHYCKTSRLERIVIIWNDIEKDIPKHILELSSSCSVPLVFIKETENKITNRFKPRKEIQTDCELYLVLYYGICIH